MNHSEKQVVERDGRAQGSAPAGRSISSTCKVRISCSFKKAGSYSIKAKYKEYHIRGSPATILAPPGSISPLNSTVVAPGYGQYPSALCVTECQYIAFECIAFDGYENKIEAGVHESGFHMRVKRPSPEGSSSLPFLSEEEQRQIMSYTVLQSGSGNYLLSVQFLKQGIFDVVAMYQEIPLHCGTRRVLVSSPQVMKAVKSFLHEGSEKSESFTAYFNIRLLSNHGFRFLHGTDCGLAARLCLNPKTSLISISRHYPFAFSLASWKLSQSVIIRPVDGAFDTNQSVSKRAISISLPQSARDLVFEVCEPYPSPLQNLLKIGDGGEYAEDIVRDFVMKTLSTVCNQGGYQLNGSSSIELPVLPPFEDLKTKMLAISRTLASGFPRSSLGYVHVKFDRGLASDPDKQQESADKLLAESLKALQNVKRQEWRCPFRLFFVGEGGDEGVIDAAGPMREFFSVCSRVFFCSSSESRFFEGVSDALPGISRKECNSPFSNLGEGGKLMPNPSYVGRDSDFELIGRLLGKILYDNCTYEFLADSCEEDIQFLKNRIAPRVQINLAHSLYKLLLGLRPDLEDLQKDDPSFFESKISYLLQNSIDDLDLGLTFTDEVCDSNGKVKEVELCRNGRRKVVIDANKKEYIDHILHFRLIARVQLKLDSFLRGFWSLVPQSVISSLTPDELETLLCGEKGFNFDDWKSATRYLGKLSSYSKVVRWFWAIVEGFSSEEINALLQFTCGTSHIPVGGFSALSPPFSICPLENCTTDSLPKAHTCFNTLALPSTCQSLQSLRVKLLQAIFDGADSFGFA